MTTFCFTFCVRERERRAAATFLCFRLNPNIRIKMPSNTWRAKHSLLPLALSISRHTALGDAPLPSAFLMSTPADWLPAANIQAAINQPVNQRSGSRTTRVSILLLMVQLCFVHVTCAHRSGSVRYLTTQRTRVPVICSHVTGSTAVTNLSEVHHPARPL